MLILPTLKTEPTRLLKSQFQQISSHKKKGTKRKEAQTTTKFSVYIYKTANTQTTFQRPNFHNTKA